jgi:hypothetical protein
VLTALGLVLASPVAAACGTGTGVVDIAPRAATPSGGAPQVTEQVTGAARGLDPLAASSYRPVVRHGGTPHPGVGPAPGSLAGPGTSASPVTPGAQRSVRYTDGVTVRVDRIAHGVEEGNGPGVFPGRPHTALFLTLVNGTTRPLDLNQVVVTTRYGAPPRLASPVYEDPAARDFSGTVLAGQSATATYVFSVPADAAGPVVVMVDFDDEHVAARLSGGE